VRTGKCQGGIPTGYCEGGKVVKEGGRGGGGIRKLASRGDTGDTGALFHIAQFTL
jgi:hypothetical protein